MFPDRIPFVGLFALAGLPAAAAVVNFVVLISALSSANSGGFSTSKMLFGLARDNAAPRALGKLSSLNVPLRGLLLSVFCMFTGAALLFIMPSVMVVFTLFRGSAYFHLEHDPDFLACLSQAESLSPAKGAVQASRRKSDGLEQSDILRVNADSPRAEG
ncbi:TPA: amino acid permease [Klebsiella pneumoniae]|nr:amino acid permease [Klebsiella pneumoniae]